MKRLSHLKGKARRRCMRLLRTVLEQEHGVLYVRHDHEFRNAWRLHDAGLLTAAASRPSWGIGDWAFRELALFMDEAEAMQRYPRTVLPRRGDRR